jgi:hypothetical protein
MKLKPKITIADHFSDLEDPRIERTKHHQLQRFPLLRGTVAAMSKPIS